MIILPSLIDKNVYFMFTDEVEIKIFFDGCKFWSSIQVMPYNRNKIKFYINLHYRSREMPLEKFL